MIHRGLSRLGGAFLDLAGVIGGMGVLSGSVGARVGVLRVDRLELVRNMHKMGVHSLPIVAFTAIFVGAIMVLQAAPIVERFNAKGMLGWAAGYSTLRELGPLLTALMLSGRVGAKNAAELGTMVVTEQVDALRALAIDPVGYLVAPRFLAMVVTFFLSTVFSDVLALSGAALVGDVVLDVEPMIFYQGIVGGRLNSSDVIHGLIKSIGFGWVVASSTCHFGMTTTGGAPGVGRTVTTSVVVSAVGVFALDYFVSFLAA